MGMLIFHLADPHAGLIQTAYFPASLLQAAAEIYSLPAPGFFSYTLIKCSSLNKL